MKVFVRHISGAGGHFVAALIYSLLYPIEVTVSKEGSGHNHQDIYGSHNYNTIAYSNCLVRDQNIDNAYMKYTEPEYNNQYPNISEGVQWFKEHVKYNDQDWHLIRSHAANLNSLIVAAGIDDSKIINITVEDSDIDQMCYNYVTKTILTNEKWAYERGPDVINPLYYHYPYMKSIIDIDVLDIKVKQGDVKFFTWLIKYAWQQGWNNYREYMPPVDFNVFELTWKDLTNKNLANRLNDLTAFLGISITDEQRANAIAAINKYAEAQTPVPFVINFSDF